MKLNFIQNLSDQVVRENHDLKQQLQRARQQLKDYEWEMLDVIAAIAPQPSLALTPAEAFSDFVRYVRSQLADGKQIRQHSLLLREKYEALQKEQASNINAISQLKLSLQSQQKEHEEAVERLRERQQQTEEELQWQRECANRLTDEMSDIKIEKMKLEEGKRKAIEDMRHNQNSQLIQFREKNQEDHMRVEKELRRELELRDQTIKQMNKSLVALTDAKDLSSQKEILAGIFKSFQNYEQLLAINADLKQENQQLREQVKSLFNRIIQIETRLEQAKAGEFNAHSELQRTFLEKQDLEKQLLLRIAENAKHERDKEAMEQYYDQKWNSEYKKVKQKLEGTYNSKLEELEKQGLTKIVDFQNMIRELIHEKEDYAQQLIELGKLYRLEQAEKRALQHDIQSLKQRIQELSISSRENKMMAAEELLTRRVVFAQIKTELFQIIRQRNQKIEQQVQKMRLFQIEHHKQVKELHQMYGTQLQKQKTSFVQQINSLNAKNYAQIQELNNKILSHIQNAKRIRGIVEAQCDIKLQAQQSIRLDALAVKEEQKTSLNQRWIDKYCELERLLNFTRRKYVQEIGCTKNQLNSLLQSEYQLHEQRQTHCEQIKCLEMQIKALQGEIQDKRTTISSKQNTIATVKRELALTRSEVEVLLANRKQWKAELLDVQRDYCRQFESLRKLFQKQISHYKDKIYELEGLNKMKSLTRREMEKMQNISTERESFRSEMQLKETENLILQQVKDYYQTRLRESEGQLARSDFKTTHTIIARRPKKQRLCNQEVASQRALDSREPVFQKRRYAITSAKKHYNLSLSKGRLEESSRRTDARTITSMG